MTFIVSTSFSNVAFQLFDSVFTSTYRSYLVVINEMAAGTSTDDLILQFRYGGNTTQAANYFGSCITAAYNSASVANTGTNSATQALIDDRLNKLKAGHELEFEDLKTISYGRGKWDCIFRVAKMKAEWISNKKANVTFTCKYWGSEDTYEIVTKTGILDKYLISTLRH
jgi:hypothetical protein